MCNSESHRPGIQRYRILRLSEFDPQNSIPSQVPTAPSLPASPEEAEMLELAVDPDETSRLSCQIEITDDLDGLIVRVPESQF